MTGRQVLGAVVLILLATAVLPPAVAWTVNERRIARAHREAAALAGDPARVLTNPLPDDPWGNPYRLIDAGPTRSCCRSGRTASSTPRPGQRPPLATTSSPESVHRCPHNVSGEIRHVSRLRAAKQFR